MTILGIETSCDETGAAIVTDTKTPHSLQIISNVLASSLALHSKTGGIIPEIAARQQMQYIIPVIERVLRESKTHTIDAIAVTVGPGLIGPLLVGVETAKTLSYVWKKPLIPVNHLLGHLYANFIVTNDERPKTIDFPTLGLIVSGGHTDLVLMKNHSTVQLLGGTRDDAAGEAFDKIGRRLGIPYPAGPSIEKLAQNGDAKRFLFPRPMIDSGDFDFSFSGLKTAAIRQVKSLGKLNNETIQDIASGVQQAVIEVLVKKTILAAQKYKVKSILLGGGVSANEQLRTQIIHNTKYVIPDTEIFFSKKFLCTDNAAMIAAAAFYQNVEVPWKNVTPNPQLYFE